MSTEPQRADVISQTTAKEWPFLIIRQPMPINDRPDEFRQMIEAHKRHPGACDEMWFATGSRKTIPELEKEVSTFARYRELCESAGILPGYQQGLTLGHGESHDGKPKPGEQGFPEDAWQVGRDGERIPFLCPRSPDVLRYEREYAKAVIRVANPSSYWIDDDLRLGVSKREGCFCDRCLAAFNAANGGSWTRETLVARLFDAEIPRDPVRAAWSKFNGESLAVYAAEVRKAADELGSPCRLAYQAVSANRTYTALDYSPIFSVLSGSSGDSVGIRPGHGFYNEAEPRGMVAKCLAISREAERIRASATDSQRVASICYEEETYPRHILHKTPGAILTECSLALASGCDSLSLYWFPGEDPIPLADYDFFLAKVSAARPYFERLAAATRRTNLAGLARYVGSVAAQTADFDLYDETDFHLACAGIPVTVARSGASAVYVNEKSLREMSEDTGGGEAKERGLAIVDISGTGRFPTAARRTALLDDLDSVTKNAFPVRVDECRALRILPRTRKDGRLDCVTLLNLSVGETGPLTIRLRNPVSRQIVWQGPDGAQPVSLRAVPGENSNEIVVSLAGLTPWQIGTLFCVDAPIAPSDPSEWPTYDGTELPIEGRGWPVQRLASPYQRLPVDSHASLPDAVRGLQDNSAGICFRFVTDSSKLRIYWRCTNPVKQMWNLSASGADGVDVYQRREDGWHYTRPPFPIVPMNEGAEYTWDVEPGLETLIYLPTYNRIAEFRLAVEPGCSVRPAPPRTGIAAKPVVFYGTSITQGASASHPGGAWVARAARIAGVEAINLGFSGSGKMEDALLDCVSQLDASLFVLDTVSNMPPELIDERMESFVRRLAERRPGTPILLTANRFVMGENARSRDAAVRAVYDKLKAEDPAKWAILHFAGSDASALAPDDDGTVDGLHLNDLGMKRAGDYFGAVISKLLR